MSQMYVQLLRYYTLLKVTKYQIWHKIFSWLYLAQYNKNKKLQVPKLIFRVHIKVAIPYLIEKHFCVGI